MDRGRAVWLTFPTFQRQAIAKNINDALEQFSPEVRSEVVILFSAHSLPLSVVK